MTESFRTTQFTNDMPYSSPRQWLRRLIIVLPPLILVTWLWTVGTYSHIRDLGGIFFATAAVWFFLVLRAHAASRVVLNPHSKYNYFKAFLSPRVTFTWLLACWITLSVLDAALEAHSLPLRGMVAAPPNMLPAYGTLRVGLALSGGGYRAALIHAGVLQELSAHGVPVTNISSVSGGSIIGAFVAQGGDPIDFSGAVQEGRFRFKRELLSALNLPRWLNPLGSYSRQDVQADLIRRVLLASPDETTDAEKKRPELMLAMTDLSRTMSIGAIEKTGIIIAGQSSSRFLKTDEAIAIDSLGDISNIVAISGAFPGIFPAKHTKARFTVDPVTLSHSNNVREIELILADGGIRDNLGLKLLEVVNEHARGTNKYITSSWSGFQPGPNWALDMIIISDGGKSLAANETIRGPLSELMQAIDAASIETGIYRPMENSDALPKVFLSMAGLKIGPDGILRGYPHPQSARERYSFFQPQQLDNKILTEIVNIVPNQAQAQQALVEYLKSKGSVNLSMVDANCLTPKLGYEDSAECSWWKLVSIVGADIERASTIFRHTETLEDHFSPDNAAALVRLGRYFVLLKWKEIEEGMKLTSKRKV